MIHRSKTTRIVAAQLGKSRHWLRMLRAVWATAAPSRDEAWGSEVTAGETLAKFRPVLGTVSTESTRTA